MRGVNLFYDDVFLLANVVFTEQRVLDDVGKHVDPRTVVRTWHLAPVPRELAVCEGVQHTADRLDLTADVARFGARWSSLEEHVLKEVRDAGFCVSLKPAACAD